MKLYFNNNYIGYVTKEISITREECSNISKVKLEFNEVTEELTTHLNSEVLGRNSKTGKWQYDIKLNTPNHFWDCLNMLLVMMDIYEVLKDGGDESKDDSKEDGNN